MNKKVAAIMAALLVVIVGVFSIGMKKDKTTEVANNDTVVVTDANGQSVELNKNPERVVVLDFGVADILHNMDVEIVGLAKGKKLHDKRQDLAKKDAQRTIERELRGKY